MQRNLSTYVLQKMLLPLKTRQWPAIIIANRSLDQIGQYFRTDIYGKSSQDVSDFVEMLMDSFRRKTFAEIEFRPLKVASSPDRDRELRRLAGEENDMKTLGFEFPVEKGWLNEVWY